MLKNNKTNNNSDASEQNTECVIVTTATSHDYKVFLTGPIDFSENYIDLIHSLETAGENDTFTINIDSPGGIVKSSIIICDAMKRSKAKITTRVTGHCMSAAVQIFLSGDEMYIGDHALFMMHNHSSGAFGEAAKVRATLESTDRWCRAYFREFWEDLLDEEAITKILEEDNTLHYTGREMREMILHSELYKNRLLAS